MLGLRMYEEYLVYILKGNKSCDVRLYSSPKRGKIGLIKSKINLLYGYVDFVSVEQISYEEYVYWHVGENYSMADAEIHIEVNRRNKNKQLKRAYKYSFINPVLLDEPIKIKQIRKEGSWIEFDEKTIYPWYSKIELF